ncbi:DegT/DnrJ/EryC1/StrS family aminotransferase [Saccharothrix variisporea]|uniref:Aminotransferase n=1 Tax=Saccharothrix variisporea TaxID=543527 RepID=A0A495XP78_9PSEU|nr:DegT/DnrJ/EryC1/StrS family aminotransferase [Saccharothrix variisporea]RKT74686.1 aminotransferase [Saccharothrix variisporea]
MISLFQPQVGDEELAAVAEVVASRWLGHGPRTAAFEAEFAEHLGVDPARVVFLASGSASLFLAIESLDLGPGDEVVLPSVSFIAAANAIVSCGARPVFCDVDPRTLNPTAEDVAAAITPRTKAVVVLHYGGYPGDVERIAALCRDRGVELVEDAACSVASRVGGRACGTFGDSAIWSFDAMKVLTTGDGGMLYVRDPDRALRVRRLAYHGLAQLSGFSGAKSSRQWWKLDVQEPGRRVIGNDLTAAIGSVQLRRLGGLVARRREIVELYDRELADVPGVLPPPALPEGHETSYYFYWVQLADGIRDDVASDLYAAGIYTTFRYEPLHKVPLYGFDGELPHSDHLATRTLCLPLHPGLTDADVHTVVSQLRKAVEARTTA